MQCYTDIRSTAFPVACAARDISNQNGTLCKIQKNVILCRKDIPGGT